MQGIFWDITEPRQAQLALRKNEERLREAQRRQALVGSLVVLLLLGFAGLLVYYRHAFLTSTGHHA